MKRRHLLLAAGLGLLLGCSSDKATGTSGLSGVVSFTFTGGGGGSFSATGAVPAGTAESAQWSAGIRDDANAVVVVEGLRPTTGNNYDQVVIFIPRVTTGSATFDINCSTPDCVADFAFNIGFNTQNSDFIQFCFLTAGTVTITSINNSRVEGTFAGTGTCVPFSGGNQTTFTVTNGTFNVALISTL